MVCFPCFECLLSLLISRHVYILLPTQYRSLRYLVSACKTSKKQIWAKKLTAQAIEFCTPQRPEDAWFDGVLWLLEQVGFGGLTNHSGDSSYDELTLLPQISSHFSIVLLPPSSYLPFDSLWLASQPDLYSGLAEIRVSHENRRNAGIIDPKLVCAHPAATTPNQLSPQHLVLITNCTTRR